MNCAQKQNGIARLEMIFLAFFCFWGALVFAAAPTFAAKCNIRTIAARMIKGPVLSPAEKLKWVQAQVNPKTSRMSLYRFADKEEKVLEKLEFSPNEFTYKDSAKKYAEYNEGIRKSMWDELTKRYTPGRNPNTGNEFIRSRINFAQINPKKNSDVLQLLADSGLRPGKSIGMDDVVATVRHKKSIQVQQGLIQAENMLEPSLMIRFEDGRIGTITFGAPIPDGAIIESKLVTNEAFLDLLAEGRMVMGGTHFSSTQTLDGDVFLNRIYMHDFQHQSIFYRSPEIEKTIHQRAQALAGKPLSKIHANGFITSLEYLRTFNSKERAKILSLLTFTPKKTPVTVNEVLSHYSQMDEKFLRKKAETILKEQKILYEGWGGASHDPRAFARNTIKFAHPDALSPAINELSFSMSSIRQAGRDPDFYKPLAKMEALLHNIKDITPEQWISHHMGSAEIRRSSPVYEALCKSLVLSPDGGAVVEMFYKITCLPE